jgi:MoxR-like ATPase
VDRRIARYIVDVTTASRQHPSLKMGCSPRGTLLLFHTTQARAFLSGRDYAIPEDVKSVAICTLAHRLALDTKAKYSGTAKEDIVREILEQVAIAV